MTCEEKTLPEANMMAPEPYEVFDLIIIGAGPAGMSAALAAGRAKLKTLILEKSLPGGETASAFEIDNYLGYPEGILGVQLIEKMEAHLEKFQLYYACEMVEDIQVKSLYEKVVITDLNNAYIGKTVIITTGLESKKLEGDFAKRFLGRGISYCAPCDAELYHQKVVAVLGGGNCACYAADYLSHYAQKVYLIHTLSELKAVKTVKEKVLNNPIIDIMWNTRVTDVIGVHSVEKAQVTSFSTQQSTWIDVRGLFVYIGRTPSKRILNLELELDEKGYIVTDEYMRTNLKGIYAAGDIRSKQIRQIITAVSDGMIAAINAEREIASLS